MSGKWNRAARKSGGSKPTKIVVPAINRQDAEFVLWIEKVRRDFGEDGVKRFLELAQERQTVAIAKVKSIPEGLHETWPSGLHAVGCRGCEVREAKREALKELGCDDSELPQRYGRS